MKPFAASLFWQQSAFWDVATLLTHPQRTSICRLPTCSLRPPRHILLP